MFVTALAAIAMFAAPADAQGDAKAKKPAMEKVCYKVELSGSNLPKKHCEMRPVKAAAETATEEKPAEAPKSE